MNSQIKETANHGILAVAVGDSELCGTDAACAPVLV